MKKKVIIILTAVVLAAAVIVSLLPKPLLGKDVLIGSIEYNREDITDQIDHEELLEILSEAETVLTLNSASSYLIEEYPLEINLVNDRKPLHIVMGKTYFAYRSGSGLERKVCNGEEVYGKIIELIEIRK